MVVKRYKRQRPGGERHKNEELFNPFLCGFVPTILFNNEISKWSL